MTRMADFRTLGVNSACCSPVLLLVLTVATSTVLASICPDNQYLNADLQTCMNCTECERGLVVLRPCELHRDTHCAPIGDLTELLSGTGTAGNRNRHHRHHHEKYRRDRRKNAPPRYESGVDAGAPSPPVALEVASSDAPFSSAETLVWDWQAVALSSAVFACILFFLVITLYSLHQARQWRRLKENFEADVEDLSARLSLMAAASAEKCEILETVDGAGCGATTGGSDPNYLNNRCVYLEQLLSVRKEDEKNSSSKPKGNVYIEENKPKK